MSTGSTFFKTRLPRMLNKFGLIQSFYENDQSDWGEGEEETDRVNLQSNRAFFALLVVARFQFLIQHIGFYSRNQLCLVMLPYCSRSFYLVSG